MNKIAVLIRRWDNYYNNNEPNYLGGKKSPVYLNEKFLTFWDKYIKIRYLDFRKSISIITENAINNIKNSVDLIIPSYNIDVDIKNFDIVYATDDDDFFCGDLIDFLKNIQNLEKYDLITWNAYQINSNGIKEYDNYLPFKKEPHELLSNCYAIQTKSIIYKDTNATRSHMTTARTFLNGKNVRCLHCINRYSIRFFGFWSLSKIKILTDISVNNKKNIEDEFKKIIYEYKKNLYDNKNEIIKSIFYKDLKQYTSDYIDIILSNLK